MWGPWWSLVSGMMHQLPPGAPRKTVEVCEVPVRDTGQPMPHERVPTERQTEETCEAADPSEQTNAPDTGAIGGSTNGSADGAARRCLMCARWIGEARLQEEPDEVVCVEHRSELRRSRTS